MFTGTFRYILIYVIMAELSCFLIYYRLFIQINFFEYNTLFTSIIPGYNNNIIAGDLQDIIEHYQE